MMEFIKQNWYTILMLAIFGGIAAFWVIKMWKHKHRTAQTKAKEVSHQLRKYAALRKFQVIDDARFLVGGQAGGADHILIGHFGVLLVYDLMLEGSYYGSENDKKWTISTASGDRYEVTNPIPCAQACAGRINLLMKENGLPLPQVERVAVIVGDRNKVNLAIKCEELILLEDLRKYLGKAKFDQDRDLNVEKVTEILTTALVKKV